MGADIENSSINPHQEDYNSNSSNELYEFQNYNSIPVLENHQENTNVVDWAKHHFHSPGSKSVQYLRSLFPIHRWIYHYNPAWAYADIVAGVTVGVVMVPQSMSYAQIAGLEPQYGLYSAFVGVFIYCFFATSKDVSIGPVAVMSLEVAKVITRVQERDPSLPAPVIATVLSLICGCIALGLGLLRLGFILEFISMPSVLGFMTGSALNIISGQVPALMGYNKKVNTRAATYKVIIETLKHLPDTKLDAVFGLIPLFLLYSWKYICNVGPKRWPKARLWFFYTQALRNGVIIVVFTLISWGLIRHDKKSKKISVLGSVPSGLRDVGLMEFPTGVMSSLAPELPAATIVLLLEHISISKSFGRINDYKIVPDQELVAIGVTNLIGTFFNAYPATGSFSRSALKAKCNVKTPLAGIFTGACVLLALYCLTDAFYYIPKATLSAVIIHAVSDLIANYQTTLNFWKIAPIDAGIFIIAVIITVFATIEIGIYFAIAASCAVLLFNVAFPTGEFLGRVKVAQALNPEVKSLDEYSNDSNVESDQYENLSSENKKEYIKSKTISSNSKNDQDGGQRGRFNYVTRWIPLSKRNLNQDINVLPPPPGVLVFRPTESWTYLNCSHLFDKIFDEIKTRTRRGKINLSLKDIDRPWNDPGPWRPFWKKADPSILSNLPQDERPVLKVFVFDFSTVSQIDASGVQALIDLRKAVNKYADREVEFHFTGILSPWIRRALIGGGFGVEQNDARSNNNHVDIVQDEEAVFGYNAAVSTSTPFFHLDIPSLDHYQDNDI
ncbi:Sulfate permease 2 [Wickerhamomyces ciferrii]|uniref:Sulfate permease 2 n=1 Tax=Wickerhamomyces ciferrii (strain ATCC 14091 / BCRC 22168 / CBS 111 / JCM 3599 / NBRC 0793 / NRRL Y-1031 F-60-10) TaxID=1206466 RepID=K0KUM1_WICCF|nr:Sulfate permease 2 [Wickerhamomyces ciferrii]CCH45129.1 Sulfate permease 2 [Wickerhamomyces ciferrii]